MGTNPLTAFFGVVADRRAWLGLIYLAFAFPLGLLYFIYLVVGWSLGVGTLILWVGAVILLAVIALSFALSLLERQQAIWLLDTPVGPAWSHSLEGLGFWRRLGELLKNRVTWTGMLFQLLKFPFGLAAFVFLVTTFALGGALLAAPIYYRWSPLEFDLYYAYWSADTLAEALLCSLAGLLLLVVSLHVVKGVSWVWGRLAALMLGWKRGNEGASPVSAEPRAA
jgi:hypothetical protein